MMNHQPPHIAKGIRIAGALLVGGIVFLSGISIGYQNRPSMQKVVGLVHKEPAIAEAASVDFNEFWKAWQIIDSKYPGATKITNQEKVYGAIKGLLAAYGDPYTTFFTPSENKIFQGEIAGEFSGVGIEIGMKDDILTVIAPLKDTPADKAGVKAGDRIIKIGDQTTQGMSTDTAIDLIRGDKGTPVTFSIAREGEAKPLEITIVRDTITLPTVDTEVRADEKVFIIHLYNFSAHSAELFRNALVEYINSGYTNLLIDLRGNPGGYLESAVQIGGWFIPEGKVIVKEVGKSEDDVATQTSKGPTVFPKNHKLVVLVDKGSASASEILAGALSEHGIGTLAGEQTFGKGSVQEVIKLSSGTSLKVTIAKWFTPNGVSISENGLTPSVKIPQKESVDGNDPQLEEAVRLFKK